MKVSEDYEGDKFFTVMDNGVKRATPLLLVLAVIEISDVVFAVDSIPAVNHALMLRKTLLPVHLQFLIHRLGVTSSPESFLTGTRREGVRHCASQNLP